MSKSSYFVRDVAVTIVDRITQSDKDLAVDWLDEQFHRHSIAWKDRGLITEIVYGALRRLITLDWMLGQYTFHRVKDHLLKNILRVGLYQIYYLQKVPAYAVVDDMVEITKFRMGQEKARFVNAVLRRAAAKDLPTEEKGFASHPKVLGSPDGKNPLKALSLAASMPLWILERWAKTYAPDQIRQICEAANAAPAVYVRANRSKADGVALRKALEEEGVRVETTERPDVFRVKAPKSLEQLAAFREGFFFVQDPMTLRIVDFMKIGATDKILDYCAAPGGKSFYLEQKTGDGERIIAVEKNPQRFKLAVDNARRLGSKVRWMRPEALKVERTAGFDKILLDVPCSNQGVMGRRVEARWRLSADQIENQCRTQREILDEVLRWAGPAAEIYYATCSIDTAENEQVVERFTSDHAGWICEEKLLMLPQAGKQDGGFVARLIRKE